MDVFCGRRNKAWEAVHPPAGMGEPSSGLITNPVGIVPAQRRDGVRFVNHPYPPPRFDHPQGLCEGLQRVGEKLQPAHVIHDIKQPLPEGQKLCVPMNEFSRPVPAFEIFLAPAQDIERNIQANVTSMVGQSLEVGPCAYRSLQHQLAGLDVYFFKVRMPFNWLPAQFPLPGDRDAPIIRKSDSIVNPCPDPVPSGRGFWMHQTWNTLPNGKSIPALLGN